MNCKRQSLFGFFVFTLVGCSSHCNATPCAVLHVLGKRKVGSNGSEKCGSSVRGSAAACAAAAAAADDDAAKAAAAAAAADAGRSAEGAAACFR